MSMSWDVYCRTCNQSLGLSQKSEDAMHELIRLAPLICGIHTLEQEIGEWQIGASIKVLDERVNAEWFKQHLRHDLIPQDEYGRFSDRCSERVRCPHCSALHWCDLPDQHDGPHEVWPKK